MKWNLVYFDDEIENIKGLKLGLDQRFNVIGCEDPLSFESVLIETSPHGLLLDVLMPIMDGHRLHQKIITSPHYNGCPVFFISGDVSNENTLRSHQVGGVDFFPRNIELEELQLRLSGRIRTFLEKTAGLCLGNLNLDLRNYKVTVKGNSVDLTMVEMKVLAALLRFVPDEVSMEKILEKVWGNEKVRSGTVSTHITNLKAKLQDWDHTLQVRQDHIFLRPKNR